jgi:hypothetical protein
MSRAQPLRYADAQGLYVAIRSAATGTASSGALNTRISDTEDDTANTRIPSC